jgi:DNA-binding SARP family transcriptional activator
VPFFRLLGPLEVADDDGALLPLGGIRQRGVLAVLLLRAGEVVSTEFFVEALWGGEPPRTAIASLRNSISALRKLLGPELLVTRPPGYVLSLPPGSTDLGQFEALVAEARGLEAAPRAEQLGKALALWRGEPLAELAFEPFAGPDVRRLEELRLVTIEAWVDACLEAGQAAELVPELESLVAQNPLRERPRGQLMLALYRSGRQADALAAYQDARRVLVEELGLEPGPQLQRLHAQILRQEVALYSAASATDEEHLAEVALAVLEGRLVAVLGHDTSSLAERLAARFRVPAEDSVGLAHVAQYVALTKGTGPLYDELHALLGASAAPTSVHRFFASLPPLLRERGLPHQLLVTTSYDLALEAALLEAGEEFDVVSYIATGSWRGRFCHVEPDGTTHTIEIPNTYATELSLERRTIVLKLHGGLDSDPSRELESFVVTEDDYIGYLDTTEISAVIPVALTARLRRSHILFLGYRMRDWGPRLVLGRVCGRDEVRYRSWAVLPEARPLERQFWRARDIDLLEAPLDEYVDGLARHLGVPAGAAS